MRFIPTYFKILEAASNVNDEKGIEIYKLAFQALIERGLGQNINGKVYILDGDAAYAYPEDADGTIPQNQNEPNDISSAVASNSILLEDDEELSTTSNENNLGGDDTSIDLGVDLAPVNTPGFEQDVASNTENVEKEITEQNNENPFGEQSDGNPFEDENPFGNPDEGAFVVPDEEGQENPFVGEEVPFNEGDETTHETFEEHGEDFLSLDVLNTEESVSQENLNPEATTVSGEELELELSPNDLPAPSFPDHLSKKDFTFMIHSNTNEALGEEAVFIVYPLRLDVPNPIAVLKAAINGQTYYATTTSDGELKVSSDKFEYFLQTKVEDGEFNLDITIEGEADQSTFETRKKVFGKKGHVMLSDDEEGINIHIMPLSFKDNSYGYANFMFCVDDGSGELYLDVNEGEEGASFELDGKDMVVVAKWNGNSDDDKVLYAKVEPAEE